MGPLKTRLARPDHRPLTWAEMGFVVWFCGPTMGCNASEYGLGLVIGLKWNENTTRQANNINQVAVSPPRRALLGGAPRRRRRRRRRMSTWKQADGGKGFPLPRACGSPRNLLWVVRLTEARGSRAPFTTCSTKCALEALRFRRF